MFIHQSLGDLPKLKTIHGPDGRIIQLPSGIFVPSVTTVIGAFYAPSRNKILKSWRRRVGEEESVKITKQAAHRGTSNHKALEKFLLNDENWSKGVMPFNLHELLPITKLLTDNIDLVYGIERQLYSETLMTAGTADLLANWKGEPTVIDFKTSRKPKKREWVEHYFVQGACYARMAKELFGLDIRQILLLMIIEHSEPEIFISETYKYDDLVHRIFISERKIDGQINPT